MKRTALCLLISRWLACQSKNAFCSAGKTAGSFNLSSSFFVHWIFIDNTSCNPPIARVLVSGNIIARVPRNTKKVLHGSHWFYESLHRLPRCRQQQEPDDLERYIKLFRVFSPSRSIRSCQGQVPCLKIRRCAESYDLIDLRQHLLLVELVIKATHRDIHLMVFELKMNTQSTEGTFNN